MKFFLHILLHLFVSKSILSQNSIKEIIKEYNYSTDSFFIGASLNHFQLNSNDENLFLNEFNYMTPANSFKQTVIHPKPGVWKWDRANNFIDFAKNNNLNIRVHGPISPQASKWVKDDNRTAFELNNILEEYFTSLCKRINKESNVKWMDVVNETVKRDGSWFSEKPGTDKWENPWTQIGFNQDSIPKYIVKAFEIANQYATNVKLVYNHNGAMEKIMWKKIMETISYLKAKGLRVDAIGWQAHLRTNSLSENDMIFFDYLIDWAHENNLEFHVTELNLWIKDDINNLDSVQNIQSGLYKKIIEKLISKKSSGIVALNFWGLKNRTGNNSLNKNILSIYNRNGTASKSLNQIKKSLINYSNF